MSVVYYCLHDLVEMIDERPRDICKQILRDHINLFLRARGSSHNHQAWTGGYYDHITEVMNMGRHLYPQMSRLRRLPFSVSDVLLVLFIHDLEKPWKYEIVEGKLQIKPELASKDAQRKHRDQTLQRYGLELTADQRTALLYVEGEGQDYSATKRTMNPLGAFCHMIDVASARIWYDCPAIEDDQWQGAVRTTLQS
jgi:23S rRNA maturation-related 3'-5' exoribonuclease YhaM